MAKPRREVEKVGLLPLTVREASGEPAISLLRRLAVRRGSPTLNCFLAGVPHCPSWIAKSVTSGCDLDVVARMSGLPLALLEASTLVKKLDGYFVGCVQIERRGWIIPKRSNGRVCPLCLAEDLDARCGPSECRPFRRFWWDLDEVDGCPDHGVQLLAFCPGCGRSLHQINMRPDRCSCGCMLVSVLPTSRLDGFDRCLVGMLRGAAPPPWAAGMTIRSIAGLALRVGVLDDLGPVRGRRTSLAPRDRMELSARGADILDQGRDALLATLDRHAAKTRRTTPGTLYGELYIWLAHREDDDGLTWVRNLVISHASQALRIRSGIKVFGKQIVPTLGTGKGIPAGDAFDGAIRTAHAQPGSDFEKLRRVLGLSVGQIINARARIDQPMAGAVRRRSSTYHYDVAGVINLLERAAECPRYDKVPAGKVAVMDVHYINRTWRWGAVYSALRARTINVVGILRGKTGLPALLVDLSDVIAAFPLAKEEGSVPTLSAPEAQKFTGYWPETLRALRVRRLLVYAKRPGADWRTVWGPTVQSIRACEREFVMLKELQQVSGQNRCQVLAALKTKSVASILGSRKRVQRLFPRAEALIALGLSA